VIRRTLLVILAGLLSTLAHASDAPVDYSGHYELVDRHPERIFTLDLTQKGSRVHVVFFAAILNDPGAKPIGQGEGRINDRGVLQFTFKDNFLNEGTATIEPVNDDFRVEMRITKFVDPAPLHFYGALTMKKKPDTSLKIVSSG
jgi:hypothetical protein